MILVDTNLLIYAVNRDLPPHPEARTWLERVLSGSEGVGLPWMVLLAFLRLMTSGRVFERPLAVEGATAYVDQWLSQPVVTVLTSGSTPWRILRNLLMRSGSGANSTTDAPIAALVLEHGYTAYSCDHDLKRFPGLKHIDPVAEPRGAWMQFGRESDGTWVGPAAWWLAGFCAGWEVVGRASPALRRMGRGPGLRGTAGSGGASVWGYTCGVQSMSAGVGRAGARFVRARGWGSMGRLGNRREGVRGR